MIDLANHGINHRSVGDTGGSSISNAHAHIHSGKQRQGGHVQVSEERNHRVGRKRQCISRSAPPRPHHQQPEGKLPTCVGSANHCSCIHHCSLPWSPRVAGLGGVSGPCFTDGALGVSVSKSSTPLLVSLPLCECVCVCVHACVVRGTVQGWNSGHRVCLWKWFYKLSHPVGMSSRQRSRPL